MQHYSSLAFFFLLFSLRLSRSLQLDCRFCCCVVDGDIGRAGGFGGGVIPSSICMQQYYFVEYFRKDIDCLGAQHKIHIIINNNNGNTTTTSSSDTKQRENKSNK